MDKKYELTPQSIINARRVFEIKDVVANLMNDCIAVPTSYIEEYNKLLDDKETLKLVEEETERVKKIYMEKFKKLEEMEANNNEGN